VFPTDDLQDDFPRVITPILAGRNLLGYISVIEIEKSLTDQQCSAIEEASIIIALELVTEETARASMLPLLINAQEEERKRIARELHDETSQAISALMVNLDMIKMDIMENPEAANQRLVSTKSIADGMLDNIYRLISNLRPSLLDDLGLSSTITWFCEQRLKPVGIEYKIEIKGLEKRVPSPIEIALYRIAQEGITNIIRHTKATLVLIQLVLEGGYLSLTIKDNGQGFNPRLLLQSDKPTTKIGLWGIRERVKILNGIMNIKSGPLEGTELNIRVPII